MKNPEEIRDMLARGDAPEAMARMLARQEKGGPPDFTITSAKLVSVTQEGLVIAWETENAGVGEITIHRDEDGNAVIDATSMSRAFVRSVFDKLINSIRGDCWL